LLRSGADHVRCTAGRSSTDATAANRVRCHDDVQTCRQDGVIELAPPLGARTAVCATTLARRSILSRPTDRQTDRPRPLHTSLLFAVCRCVAAALQRAREKSVQSSPPGFRPDHFDNITYVKCYNAQYTQESLALASMARDDPHASITASSTRRPQAARRPQCAVKWDRNLKPKLAIMRQCTSVTDRRTLTS